MLAVNEESVRFRPASDPGHILEDVHQHIGQALKHVIARLAAVHLIYKMEVIDVEDKRIHPRILVVCLYLLDVFIEKITRIKSRKMVLFGRTYYRLILRQFDDTFTSCKDYLGHIIRLGDKIHRTQIYTLDLRIRFRCHHDNGYGS